VAIAEIFASAIAYPSVLKIANLYTSVRELMLTRKDSLATAIRERAEKGLKNKQEHVWAHEENRKLFGETRKVSEWFYIEAFNLSSKRPELAQGNYVVDQEDPYSVQRVDRVPEYWKFLVKKNQPERRPSPFTPFSAPLLTALEKITKGRVRSAASDRTATEKKREESTRNSKEQLVMKLPFQHHPNIPFNQLADDNLPAFYRKLTCQQAGDLVGASAAKRIEVTQGQLGGWWLEDSMSSGKLRETREPFGKKYSGHRR
jgi:hypothetical protein